MKEATNKFQYDNQNFFQLACIPSVSLGLSSIIIGNHLAAKYGAGTAICSIAIGNLLLWLIAITILSMVDRVNSTAIDNIKSYLGNYGGQLIAIILMVVFLGWYAFHINFSLEQLNRLQLEGHKLERGMVIRSGAALGMISATLSIGGIRLLKRITVSAFPFLVLYSLYMITRSSVSISFKGTWGISFTGVLITTLLLLPGVINFPTFFRHSRSKAHSFLALTLIIILITFFQVSSIWLDLSGSKHFAASVISAAFIIVTLTTCNLLNIYLASACWETIIPRFGGGKGFAIIGLLGTLTYTFVQISDPVLFIQDLTNAYIAILGVVLLMAYLLRIVLKHRPRPFEKAISVATWVFGCIVATIYEVQHYLSGVDSVLVGMNASVMFLLCVLFLEETAWALRKKLESKALKKQR